MPSNSGPLSPLRVVMTRPQSHFAKHFFVNPVSVVPVAFHRIGTIILSSGSRKVPVTATRLSGSPRRMAAVAVRTTKPRVFGFCPRGSVEVIQMIEPCSNAEALANDDCYGFEGCRSSVQNESGTGFRRAYSTNSAVDGVSLAIRFCMLVRGVFAGAGLRRLGDLRTRVAMKESYEINGRMVNFY